MKKLLVATLIATMLMSSTLTVCAADGSGGSETPTTESSSSHHKNSSSNNSSSVKADEIKGTGASMSVGGSSITTSVAGVYSAKTIAGGAIITPLAEVAASLGLTDGQSPYVMMFDTDVTKSDKAMACINASAEAMGGTLVSTLNIDLGAKQAGNFMPLSNGSINMVAGLPATADMAKTYSIICVQPGGVITVFEDQDINPNTVTFEVKAGLGTYGIVAK